MAEQLADIQEVTLLYPAPPNAKAPFARSVLSAMDDQQRALCDALELRRYLAT